MSKSVGLDELISTLLGAREQFGNIPVRMCSSVVVMPIAGQAIFEEDGGKELVLLGEAACAMVDVHLEKSAEAMTQKVLAKVAAK